ncbi:MAG: hypothetical protein KGI28_10345, partial [Thaumarchaeota archaeon]|nr:hypothetical protein [Nitrososphaerota archaeon]
MPHVISKQQSVVIVMHANNWTQQDLENTTVDAVLYMPANSIGKIYVRYFNPNELKNANLTIFDASSYQTAKSITSWAESSMI